MKNRDWLASSALPLALSLADAAWTYPWAVLTGWWAGLSGPRPLLSVASVAGLLLISWGFSATVTRRLMSGGRVQAARASSVAAAFAAVALAIAAEYGAFWADRSMGYIGPPLAAALFGFLLWWRGSTRATWRGGVDGAERDFKTGLTGIIAFILLSRAGSSGALAPYRQATATSLMVFVFFSLTALSLARLENARARGLARSGRALPFSRYWVGFTLLTVAGLLLAAILFTGLVSVGTLAAVFRTIMWPLAALARLALYAVAYLVGFALQGLVYLVQKAMRKPQTPPPRLGGDMSFLDQLRSAQATKSLPAWLAHASEWVFIAAVLAALGVWLARSVMRWQNQTDDGEFEEERDSVWSWGPAAGALRRWLTRARRQLALRRSRHLLHGDVRLHGGPAPETPTAIVRRIYREVLALGRDRGLPRSPHATPDEYLVTMVRGDLAPVVEDLSAITGTYVKVRYGQEAPTPREARDAEDRLKKIRQAVAVAQASATAQAPGASPPRGPAVPADPGPTGGTR